MDGRELSEVAAAATERLDFRVIWVLSTVAVLAGALAMIAVSAPDYLRQAWESLAVQVQGVGFGVRTGNVTDVIAAAAGAFMLVLPVAGMTLTYLLLCRRTGAGLARRRDAQGTSTILPCVWPRSTSSKASRTRSRE